MIIKRKIQKDVEKALFKGKVVIIYGARQVGKTTLVKEIQSAHSERAVYLNCDEPDIRSALSDKTSTELKSFLGDSRLVIMDEAQRVQDIGITLKLLTDNFPNMQIIATGSSSFDLSNRIVEPLTGRKYEFYLHPFALEELSSVHSKTEINRLLEQRIVLGMYPGVVFAGQEAQSVLKNLAQSYLYKDVLEFQHIKNAETIARLLQSLALQIGNEVSYNELAQMCGIDKNTVSHYIQILEKAFVIFRLGPFSRNLRNELKRLRKIYFFDTGVRNALINNFNPLNLRQDTGALWENFFISERMKHNHNNGLSPNMYFWRTREGKELDLVEESGGMLRGMEVKWRQEKFKKPDLFLETYPNSSVELVNNQNYLEFLWSQKNTN